jgi:PAS domain S-box-containing protein
MNIYSKILITTLPLVFLLLLSTVGISTYFTRKALIELAETWLDSRLSAAVQIAVEHDGKVSRDGLEAIPASLTKAKIDAGVAMAAIEVGELGFIFAIDRRGIIAVHPNTTMVGRDQSEASWFKGLKPETSRLMQLSAEVKSLAMVDYFEPWEWYILAIDPEQEIFGVANRIKSYLIGLGLVGFGAMAGALMLLTRRFMKPLLLLTTGAEQIGKGDLDTRLSISSQDEFGRLARVFNQMAIQLQGTLTELQHREARFRSLIENSSDLIAILNADGCISYLSPSIEGILGYPRDAVMGRRAFDFVHPEDRDRVHSMFNTCIQPDTTNSPSILRFNHSPSIDQTLGQPQDAGPGREGFNFVHPEELDRALVTYNHRTESDTTNAWPELRIRHQDGSWRTIEATGNNQLDHPAVKGLVINARDVSKRKEAEAALHQSHYELEERVAKRTAELYKTNAQLQREIEDRQQMIKEKEQLQDQLLQAHKMEAIGTLAGGIAHDFNNLLMAIQGNVEMMLLDMGYGHAHRDRLDTLQKCVLSGTQLTQQLLGFARLGKYEVQITDPNELVTKCTDMFGRTKQELRIVSNFQKDVWAVSVDQGQLEQVLLNLFINAWQAMPEGGRINLETANEVLGDRRASLHQVSTGNYVRISISDTGTGMDKATMNRIFDPFFTTKTMKRGTGLGLASAYGIIKNHGGYIDVQSEIGHGTVFSIYLKAFDEAIIETETKPETPRKGNETILLVDDDALIVDVGQAMLGALGYDVLTADSGERAISVYKENRDRISLIILDLIMPDMDGGRAYDRLKAF